jgi:hypothetical protein
VSLLYVIDTGQQAIFMHLSGVISDWELGTRAQQVWEEPAFRPQFARLIDASDVIDWRAETSLLRAIASDVRMNNPSKVALVAQSEPILTQLNLYVESLAGIPAQIFRTVHEAIGWLGVRPPEPWPPEERG